MHLEVSVPAVDRPVLRKCGTYLHGAGIHARRSLAFWIEVRKPWIKLIKLSEHPMHLRLLIVRVACAGERYAVLPVREKSPPALVSPWALRSMGACRRSQATCRHRPSSHLNDLIVSRAVRAAVESLVKKEIVRPTVVHFHQEQKEEPQLPAPAAAHPSESRWELIQRNGRAIDCSRAA